MDACTRSGPSPTTATIGAANPRPEHCCVQLSVASSEKADSHSPPDGSTPLFERNPPMTTHLLTPTGTGHTAGDLGGGAR